VVGGDTPPLLEVATVRGVETADARIERLEVKTK